MTLSHSLALLALATASPALAQETYLFAQNPTSSSEVLIGTLQLDGGAIFSEAAIDVAPQVSISVVPTGIEWVGQDVWMSSSRGVDRFSGTQLALIGTSLAGERVSALVPTASGAFAFVDDAVVELDGNGVELSRRPFMRVVHATSFQGGFAVINGSTNPEQIEAFDSQLQFTGTIGVGLQALATAANTGFEPNTLHPLANGGLAIGGILSIGLIDQSGAAVAIYNPGGFEQGVVELPDGNLFVPAFVDTSVVDASTGATVTSELSVNGRIALSTSSRNLGGAAALARTCSSSANSTGNAAQCSVVGTNSLGAETLSVGALNVPAGQFGVVAFGTAAGTSPFGNGTLCIDANMGLAMRSPITRANPAGSLQVDLDFQTPTLGGTITAGSTWIFQALFRDPVGGGAGFNCSDAVAVTFRN